MNHYTLICVLIVGITFCQCDIRFRIEPIASVVSPFVTYVSGPIFPRDNDEKLQELCMAAKNFISADFKEGRTSASICTLDPYMGTLSYLDSKETQKDKCWDIIFCATIPSIQLRYGQSENEIIIMIKGEDIISRTDITKYIYYNIEIMSDDPAKGSYNDESPSNEPVRIIRDNPALHEIYKSTSFLEWLHICMKAKEELELNFISDLTFDSSEVGHYLVNVFNARNNQMEEHDAFKCPTSVPVYVYFTRPKGPKDDVNVEVKAVAEIAL